MSDKEIKKSVLVIGLGRFGTSVATNLVKLGCEVVVTDTVEIRVSRIADLVAEGIVGDVQNVEFLQSLGIPNFDDVVVGIGYDIKASVLVATMLKEMGAKHVVAKAYDSLHATVLKKVGVDWVVSVEEEMGRRVAMGVKSDKLIDYMDLSPEFRFVELNVLERWVGRKVGDIKAFQNHDLMLVAIKRGKKVIAGPSTAVTLGSGDVVVVFGDHDKLKQLG